ncbi:MAG: hypothetical protein KJ040_04185 [Gammaproteobacteria bacterium]|nr:hypothetical protein [Gammaproteobacteria bacterium]
MNCLDRVMELTDEIEERVLAGDWAGATGLDVERRQLLGEMFARDPDAAGSSNRAILEQLRARNEITMAAVSSARQVLTIAARQLESAPAMMRAYERNTAQADVGTAMAGG